MMSLSRLTAGIGVATIVALINGCDDAGPTEPNSVTPLVVLSDTAVVRDAVSATGLGASLASVSGEEVAYVSAATGSFPDGVSAVIRNRRSGVSQTNLVQNGGFDPIAIVARAADTLETVVSLSGGDARTMVSIVPARRRPVVVRTIPPRRKNDVPLNTRIEIVFSEPIDIATLSLSTVKLMIGSAEVSGEIEIIDPSGLVVQFTPRALLAANTSYELVVSEGVRDLDGDAIEAPFVVDFTTGTATASTLTLTPTAPTFGVDDAFTLTVRDQYGEPYLGELSWRSDDATVVTVQGSGGAEGYLWGTGIGSTLVTATAGAMKAAVQVTVGPRRSIASVTVSPSSITMLPPQEGLFRATMWDANGAEILGRSVTWTIDDASVVALDTAGRGGIWAFITAIGIGTGQLTATVEGVKGTTTISVPRLRFTTVSAGNPDAYLGFSLWDGHACGLVESGEAFCWGANDWGQLGSGNRNSSSAIVAVSGVLKFSSISVGGTHTCGLGAEGRAYCWGAWGGPTHATNGDSIPVALPGGLTLVSLDAGMQGACGVTASSVAYCWSSGTAEPTAVGGGIQFATVSVGNWHACGLTADGSAYCWGQNGYGTLGHGSNSDSAEPVAVSGGHKFTSLTVGHVYTCGIATDRTAYCWGANGDGELGDGTTVTRLVPTRVIGDVSFVTLSAGAGYGGGDSRPGSTTCGLTADGTAYCWGANNFGQIGDGSTLPRLSPTAVAGGLRFSSISSGGKHTCGSSTQGVVFCWGSANSGLVYGSVPVKIAGQPQVDP